MTNEVIAAAAVVTLGVMCVVRVSDRPDFAPSLGTVGLLPCPSRQVGTVSKMHVSIEGPGRAPVHRKRSSNSRASPSCCPPHSHLYATVYWEHWQRLCCTVKLTPGGQCSHVRFFPAKHW